MAADTKQKRKSFVSVQKMCNVEFFFHLWSKMIYFSHMTVMAEQFDLMAAVAEIYEYSPIYFKISLTGNLAEFGLAQIIFHYS